MTTEARSSYAVVQVGDGRFQRWEVSGPGLSLAAFNTATLAGRAASRLAVLGRNEDAWAFELEQASHISMQRIAQVRDALKEYALDIGHDRYADMTPAQRVRALLVAGHARFAFDGRMGLHSMGFAVSIARAQRHSGIQPVADAIDGRRIVETTAEEQA